MSMNKLKIEEVVEAAGRTVVGTPSGLVSQQAQAELTKRLIDSNESLRKATEDNNKATAKYNSTMFDFTIILTFLAALQIVVSILPSDMSWLLRVGVSLAPVVVIYVGLKYK